jgi:hypothetical protein
MLLKIPAKQGIIAESEAKARRLYNEYKARQESKTEGDIELVNLKKREERLRDRLRLSKEKNQVRKDIASILIRDESCKS